ncbi:hypothetical protein, partial [Puniceibacterium antarcticum]|uniref:hypothetical protein n=1 Tax=Puniceibacterium antarcticum TaxID=1206336 RepID=UPI001C556CD2
SAAGEGGSTVTVPNPQAVFSKKRKFWQFSSEQPGNLAFHGPKICQNEAEVCAYGRFSPPDDNFDIRISRNLPPHWRIPLNLSRKYLQKYDAIQRIPATSPTAAL